MWSSWCILPWLLVDRWPRDFEDDRGAGWTLVDGVGVETDLTFDGVVEDDVVVVLVVPLPETDALRFDGTGVLRPRPGCSISTKEGSSGRVVSTAAGWLCVNSTGITAVEVVAVPVVISPR